jgi:DNA primase
LSDELDMLDTKVFSFLGPFKERKYEFIFETCPFCKNSNSNFQLNIDKNIYHCWVCNASGKVSKLLKDFGIEYDKTEWKSSLKVEKPKGEELILDNFHPVNYDQYKDFFAGRGLDRTDVVKYRILTATSGRYKNKIIVPLYEGPKLVYFVAKDPIFKGYTNPVIDKKTLLPYYLGTHSKLTLYICEGAFDAIVINKLGFSAGVLIGSSISDGQIRKIKEFGFTTVAVTLDGDIKNSAVKIYDKIALQGLKVKFVWFDDDDDPNDLYVVDQAFLKRKLERASELTTADKLKVMLKCV